MLVINNTTNNNNNFNINIFLNEKCKDAINMTDFVNLIKNSISDISNCITNKNLNIESSNLVKLYRNEENIKLKIEKGQDVFERGHNSVSYTYLTLPTKA